MTYALSVHARALAEIEGARERYAAVGHGDSFIAEIDAVFDAVRAMPLRFPAVHGAIHRALLRRYPFSVFFRIRPATDLVVILAVLPQRADPTKWPRP
ncbi:MAG: type II toxin-antitoxin system RelE/ParE family toxin [Deltaproteobacteria bacterium]|nr:type II toxin-antitoxin system RelE/ParE family toxin [Deltaproteobacteria bacterium]